MEGASLLAREIFYYNSVMCHNMLLQPLSRWGRVSGLWDDVLYLCSKASEKMLKAWQENEERAAAFAQVPAVSSSVPSSALIPDPQPNTSYFYKYLNTSYRYR